MASFSSLPEQTPPSPDDAAARAPRAVVTVMRAPLLLRTLAVVSLLFGLWGAMSSLGDVNAALLLDRPGYLFQIRDRQLQLLKRLQTQAQVAPLPSPSPPAATPAPTVQGRKDDVLLPFVEPFLRLPDTEAERLALLLGDALYEQRGVAVPLGLLQLLLCWVLISGSLATLRRQPWGPPTWSFACWASVSSALLNMLVTFVHSRTLMARLGQAVAQAVAIANGCSVETALARLWQLTRLYVVMRAAVEGLWVLLLGLTALYLQRLLQRLPTGERAAQ